jgi:hypothetical protein
MGGVDMQLVRGSNDGASPVPLAVNLRCGGFQRSLDSSVLTRSVRLAMVFFWPYKRYPRVADPATAKATIMYLRGVAIPKSYHADR